MHRGGVQVWSFYTRLFTQWDEFSLLTYVTEYSIEVYTITPLTSTSIITCCCSFTLCGELEVGLNQPSDGYQLMVTVPSAQIIGLCCVKMCWRPRKCEFFAQRLYFSFFRLKQKRAQIIVQETRTTCINIISISQCPPCRLSLRVTFLILLRTESTFLSSPLFFHEAATGTSEEIQAWKQQNGMNFLCSNCIVGFLLVFCHIFCWSLWLWASQPKQTPARLTFPMSEEIIRQPCIPWILQRCFVKAMSGEAATVYIPPLLTQ